MKSNFLCTGCVMKPYFEPPFDSWLLDYLSLGGQRMETLASLFSKDLKMVHVSTSLHALHLEDSPVSYHPWGMEIFLERYTADSVEKSIATR